jgi:hypothetical protein
MSLLTESQRRLARALSCLTYCNPFLPERIEHERAVLGDGFEQSELVWSVRPSSRVERPNLKRILVAAETLVGEVRQKLADGARGSDADLELYQDVVFYILYQRTQPILQPVMAAGGDAPKKITGYRAFEADYKEYFEIPGVDLRPPYDPPHLFASCFQVRRAFFHIFQQIVGASLPAARLRATVWQSVFTNDMRRYQRVLYDRLGDFTTLIVGPSGTGKEVVARSIARSRYVPFDARTLAFADDYRGSFHPLNLSALSPTLIESELFGHRRGAFTGALEDRAGWLEVCRPLGTVFLDELGDIDAAIQVKLLRVLQTRTFQRIGDTQPRTFHGKIIAATNRDLARQMQIGRFRDDLYYRLCSDQIRTPALREILAESPGELHNLVLFIAQRVTAARTEDAEEPSGVAMREAERLAGEVTEWIEKQLGLAYPWPGNFRELEQCVRNVLIRGEYHPAIAPAADHPMDLSGVQLTADELLCRYCTWIYAQTGNYEETARRLKLDRRTVKSKVDVALLSEWRGRVGG